MYTTERYLNAVRGTAINRLWANGGPTGDLHDAIARARVDGRTNEANAATIEVAKAQLESTDWSTVSMHLMAAKELVGLAPSGSSEAMLGRIALSRGLTPRPHPVEGGVEEQQQRHAPTLSLKETARHESCHAAMALFCKCKLDHAIVHRAGSGFTVFETPTNYSTTDEILISLAGLRKSELSDDSTAGCGSDLDRLCEAVKTKTGRVVNRDNVLHDDLILDHQSLLDRLLTSRLSGAIGLMADAIEAASPDPVSGERLTQIYTDYEAAQKRKG